MARLLVEEELSRPCLHIHLAESVATLSEKFLSSLEIEGPTRNVLSCPCLFFFLLSWFFVLFCFCASPPPPFLNEKRIPNGQSVCLVSRAVTTWFSSVHRVGVSVGTVSVELTRDWNLFRLCICPALHPAVRGTKCSVVRVCNALCAGGEGMGGGAVNGVGGGGGGGDGGISETSRLPKFVALRDRCIAVLGKPDKRRKFQQHLMLIDRSLRNMNLCQGQREGGRPHLRNRTSVS